MVTERPEAPGLSLPKPYSNAHGEQGGMGARPELFPFFNSLSEMYALEFQQVKCADVKLHDNIFEEVISKNGKKPKLLALIDDVSVTQKIQTAFFLNPTC